MKARKKQDAIENQILKERHDHIMINQDLARQKTEKFAAQKYVTVRKQKDDVIKQEIIKLEDKDHEVKQLERYEKNMMKRLYRAQTKREQVTSQILHRTFNHFLMVQDDEEGK